MDIDPPRVEALAEVTGVPLPQRAHAIEDDLHRIAILVTFGRFRGERHPQVVPAQLVDAERPLAQRDVTLDHRPGRLHYVQQAVVDRLLDVVVEQCFLPGRVVAADPGGDHVLAH